MRRFLVVAVAVSLLIAAKAAAAAQGYVYQGLVGDPSAGSLEATAAMGERELQLVAAQDRLVAPPRRFIAEKLPA